MRISSILKRSIFILLIAFIVAGCSAGGQGAPAAIEAYLQAVVEKDLNQAINLSCAAWEVDAGLDVDSFEAVEPQLQDMACVEAGTDGDYTLVECSGAIVVTYNDEAQELDLSRQTYRAIQEGGEWRMCGYQ